MSGGSESNFELGYAVNVDSHLNLLKVTRARTQGKTKPVYVFVSSLAVYGGSKCTPESYVIPE
jgi:nucleoside-diphosphate-sugar epimerase